MSDSMTDERYESNLTDERPDKEEVLNLFKEESQHSPTWRLKLERDYIRKQIRTLEARLNTIRHELENL